MPTAMSPPLVETKIPNWPVRRGKVRDCYDLGDRLLLVSTDRISAFDWVLPSGIPDKGRVLTQISAFWFDRLGEPHHLLSTDVADFGLAPRRRSRRRWPAAACWCARPRSCRSNASSAAILSGSGWKEYQKSGTVCGVRLPAGLTESDRLPEPIFTPATKEETGHDINISFDRMVEIVGVEVADELRRRSLGIYQRGAELARQRGIIIADTKFEWGQVDGELILIDEVLTPDSSRFWPADQYRPGRGQPSFDKQFVRDWLEKTAWDKNSPPPALPDEVIVRTREKYIEAFEQLTGQAVRVEVKSARIGRGDSTYLRFWCESTIVVCGAQGACAAGNHNSFHPFMLRYLTAGESHGKALVALVDGFPAGVDHRHRTDRRRAAPPPRRLRPRRAAADRNRHGRHPQRHLAGRDARQPDRAGGRQQRRQARTARTIWSARGRGMAI